MSFIKPMLAGPVPKIMSKVFSTLIAAEEKFDGHRTIVEVSTCNPGVEIVRNMQAWTRNGHQRPIPDHIQRELSMFPSGIYDGEFRVPGKKSFAVSELANSPDLVFTVFDILELLGNSTIGKTYDERRDYLTEIFNVYGSTGSSVQLAQSSLVGTWDEVNELLKEVWRRGGEGLILKRRNAVYSPGKRPSNTWVKLKELNGEVLVVVGFVPSETEKQNRGPYASVLIRDKQGAHTVVKTLNDSELAAFEEVATALKEHELFGWDKVRLPSGAWCHYHTSGHPAIGRELRIEYQEKTEDGSYRHPRWDRWDDE